MKRLIKLIGGPAAGLSFALEDVPADSISDDGRTITVPGVNGSELVYTRPDTDELTAVFDRATVREQDEDRLKRAREVMFDYPDWRDA